MSRLQVEGDEVPAVREVRLLADRILAGEQDDVSPGGGGWSRSVSWVISPEVRSTPKRFVPLPRSGWQGGDGVAEWRRRG
ncbi:hypothetical protein ABN034_13205 [Actinopolymorpha sp. B11F2]|uniref:hypothetical protein n=1 Tax=Actinopolymorpha sp. B11F2 TaxID=3160862 RepID=UPI0032E504CF